MSSKGRFEELNENIEEDFLDVDKPIPGQNFCCISFVSPDKLLTRKEDYYFHEFNKKKFQTLKNEMNAKFEDMLKEAVDGKVDVSKLEELQKQFVNNAEQHVTKGFDTFTEDLKDFRYANEEEIENKFHEDNNFQTTVRGVKIRGTYNTLKEAQIRAKVLQRMDPSFHIFVGQVGYWLPWDPTADKIENQEFQNGQLNDIVKKYKMNESKRDEFYEQQKQDRKNEALKKNAETKKTLEGAKLEIGESTSQEVSIQDTAAQLTEADPWLSRKMKTTEEDSKEVDDSNEESIKTE
jgi:hypothetical protein